jgi:hypothetical protein
MTSPLKLTPRVNTFFDTVTNPLFMTAYIPESVLRRLFPIFRSRIFPIFPIRIFPTCWWLLVSIFDLHRPD